jgi:hypothetical protein
VAQKYFLQQVDKQILFAGGFQSQSEIVEFLKAAHNIHDLPPPAGLVRGSAANESDRHELSSTEAERLARQDKNGVDRMLAAEAQNILMTLGIRQVSASDVKKIEVKESNDVTQGKS